MTMQALLEHWKERDYKSNTAWQLLIALSYGGGRLDSECIQSTSQFGAVTRHTTGLSSLLKTSVIDTNWTHMC